MKLIAAAIVYGICSSTVPVADEKGKITYELIKTPEDLKVPADARVVLCSKKIVKGGKDEAYICRVVYKGEAWFLTWNQPRKVSS